MSRFLPIICLIMLIVGGCSSARLLVDTPNVFSQNNSFPNDEVPPHLKSPRADLFYITDRQLGEDGSYSINRSASMAFGSVPVTYGNQLTWPELSKISATAKRDKKVNLTLGQTNELVRFPDTPLPFELKNGQPTTLPEAAQNYSNKIQQFQNRLAKELSRANRREVVLFVHGFNNKFDSSAFALADIWHFTGRIGVPVFYSWPAGNGGISGYFKDSESGNYSIFHFKETIRMLSSTPGLEKIHIVAHSRGTDVTTTGLRELVIEHRARGLNPRKSLKIENLVLAAPDLDFGVVRQRLIAEKFGPAFGQITVYINRNDGALGLSQRLASGLRFGRLTFDDLEDGEKKIFSRIKNVNFVNAPHIKGIIGHAYFRENPEVLSDIVIAIRDSARPGDRNRPLENVAVNFWELPKGYPFQK